MPNWSQIQAQLKHPANPVVFFDVSVGTTVSKPFRMFVFHIFGFCVIGNRPNDIRTVRRRST